VRDSYRFFQAVLDFMQVHHREMRQMARAADVRAASQPPSLATTWTAEPLAETIDIQGFEMDVQVAADGRLRVQPTEQLRTYESVPYFARYRPERQVALPGAYLLDASQRDAVAKLQQHGIVVDELAEAVELEIEVFKIQSIAPDPTLLQGHYLTRAGGEYQSATRLIEAGTFLVRLDQPLAMVVAAMLEPESSDSLLAWNVFSRAISMQLGNVQPEYPVYRLASPVEGLVTRSADPADGVHALLDELHRAAASGDSLRYLALFADNAVFMGTAPDEYFNIEQFSAYVNSRFEGGQGWSYLPSNRNIRLAEDGNTAWFEEVVTSEANGIDFRGTGIVIREGKQWRVAQYNFSLPFSNEVWPDVIRLVQ
jgi:ketosteroid isomerase-like protein